MGLMNALEHRDTHRSDQLCQRAQRGMTRRSFCFLFGAGVTGLALPGDPLRPIEKHDVARWFGVPPEVIDATHIADVIGQVTTNADGSINIYRRVNGERVFRRIATVPASERSFTDHMPVGGESLAEPITISGYWDRPEV